MTALTAKELELASSFTETYRRYENEPIALREAACLRAQYPAILMPIQDGDLFAGRIAFAPVGFRLASSTGEIGYYCEAARLQAACDSDELGKTERERCAELVSYWQERTTLHRLAVARQTPELPPEIARALYGNVAESPPLIVVYADRFAGHNLDYGKLLRLGIPGLKEEIAQQAARAAQAGRDTTFYVGLALCLELLADVSLFYATQARGQASQSARSDRERDLLAMADALERVSATPPATFREAIQLFWLTAQLASAEDYGRMDVYLGDFYVQDVDAGRITEAEALRLLQGLWRMIATPQRNWTARVIVGGSGRPHTRNADRFAVLALEATRAVGNALPQLSLRMTSDMNPQLWSKALDLIGAGYTYPILYGDDTNIPALAAAFGVSQDEAAQYVASDCGEYSLAHRSIGSPNGTTNLAKALEVTLFGGFDPLTGQRMGLASGGLAGFDTFDDLWAAYARQITHFIELLADQLAPQYDVMGQDACFLFVSMLWNDCIERGKGIFSGGARYRGELIETYGNITTADSLTAIRELVYESQALSPDVLLAMLRANFVGYEPERQLLLNAPKYGNDHPVADAMAAQVHDHICSIISAQAQRLGFDFMLADLVNVDGNISLGRHVGATPDGRRAGAPLTNANNPTVGADQRGPTALLNSMVKLKPDNIGGQVQHMKFSREMFSTHRDRLEALLKGYFANGGPQAMITVVGRGDLEAALREPDKYRHLIVRVGGFSARFVDLPRSTQEDILARTLHDVS